MKDLRFTLIAAVCLFSYASVSLAQDTTSEKQAVAPPPITYVAATKENYRKLADEVNAALLRDVLDVWFPRTVDNINGGFRPEYARKIRAAN